MLSNLADHDPHEFERPICIASTFNNVSTVVNSFTSLEKAYQEELNKLTKKFMESGAELSKILVDAIKSEGLWPYDFNEETDHLMIQNGVIFYARHRK